MIRLCGFVGFTPLFFCASAPLHAQEIVNENWKYQSTTDRLTDLSRAAIYSDGTGGAIILKCDKPGAENVYWQFSANDYLGGDFESRFMDWRVDQNRPVREMWNYKRSLAISESASLLAQIMDGKSLYMRAMRYDGRLVDATFSVGGFKEAFAKFADICLPPK